MMPGIGGGISAAEAPDIAGLPDVKAPKLGAREEAPEKKERPKISKIKNKNAEGLGGLTGGSEGVIGQVRDILQIGETLP
jgi:hypothetical protein